MDFNMPIVFTHGTDILPEAAFLSDIELDRPAPVVVSGSMRSSFRRRRFLLTQTSSSVVRKLLIPLHAADRCGGYVLRWQM